MKFIIILIGFLILLTGISLIVNPDFILGYLENNKESGVFVFGILFRTVLGILFVLTANESRHPAVITFLGYLSLLAALALVVSLTYFGQESVQEVLSTLINDYREYASVSGGLSIVIGGFLIYAFLKR